MATLGSISISAQDTSRQTTVPDDDLARLMYYLNCVTVSLKLPLLPWDLTDFMNYRFLNPQRIALVIKAAADFGPEEFEGKLIFCDDRGEVVDSTSMNVFLAISTACNTVSVQDNIMVAGRVQDVTMVMFYRSGWLHMNYTKPLERVTTALLGTQHCSHCVGSAGSCSCVNGCFRSAASKCNPPRGSYLAAPPSGLRTSASTGNLRQGQAVQTGFNCDGCGMDPIRGTRYNCSTCSNYDLCPSCYDRGVHEASHSFDKIEYPGSPFIRIAPRSHAARPPPRRKDSSLINPAPSRGASNGDAYDDLSTGSFIVEVPTYVEEPLEEIPPPPKIPSVPASTNRLKKDDTVVLVGLARTEMNGKRATVLKVDHAQEKAQIRVNGTENTFKIKFDNLKPLEEYFDSDEELA